MMVVEETVEILLELDCFPGYSFGYHRDKGLWYVEDGEGGWIWIDPKIYEEDIDVGYGYGVVGLFKAGEQLDKTQYRKLVRIMGGIDGGI